MCDLKDYIMCDLKDYIIIHHISALISLILALLFSMFCTYLSSAEEHVFIHLPVLWKLWIYLGFGK